MSKTFLKEGLLVLTLSLFYIKALPQSKVSEIDSLKDLVEKRESDDTIKVNLINELAFNLIYSASDPIGASKQLEVSKCLVNKLGYTRGLARCYEIEAHLAYFKNDHARCKHHLYRIIQEATHNSIKHSKAMCFSISVEKITGGIQLVISDDGIGVDLNAALDEEHYGMKNIKQRAEQIDAKLIIESMPGNGLKMIVSIQNQVLSE